MNPKKMTVLPEIAWVVENQGILVINTDTSIVKLLDYPDAAVWSVILRYGFRPKAVEILSAIIDSTAKNTREKIENTLINWEKEGFITVS
jgi:hypothetical protein